MSKHAYIMQALFARDYEELENILWVYSYNTQIMDIEYIEVIEMMIALADEN